MSAVKLVSPAPAAETTPAQSALAAHRAQVAELNGDFNALALRTRHLLTIQRAANAARAEAQRLREERRQAAGVLIARGERVLLADIDRQIAAADRTVVDAEKAVGELDGHDSITAALQHLATQQHAITAEIASARAHEPRLVHEVELDKLDALAPRFKAALDAFVDMLVEVGAHADRADSLATKIPGAPQCGSGNLRRFELGTLRLKSFQVCAIPLDKLIRERLANLDAESR